MSRSRASWYGSTTCRRPRLSCRSRKFSTARHASILLQKTIVCGTVCRCSRAHSAASLRRVPPASVTSLPPLQSTSCSVTPARSARSPPHAGLAGLRRMPWAGGASHSMHAEMHGQSFSHAFRDHACGDATRAAQRPRPTPLASLCGSSPNNPAVLRMSIDSIVVAPLARRPR